jgi:hypothetical protein
LTMWLASLPANAAEALPMDQTRWPPSSPAADEPVVSGGAGFAACDKGLDAFAAQGAGTVAERRYSSSPEWGYVVRAKLTLGGDASRGAPVICWAKPGQKAELFVDMGQPRR